jgi:hypothetical protein
MSNRFTLLFAVGSVASLATWWILWPENFVGNAVGSIFSSLLGASGFHLIQTQWKERVDAKALAIGDRISGCGLGGRPANLSRTWFLTTLAEGPRRLDVDVLAEKIAKHIREQIQRPTDRDEPGIVLNDARSLLLGGNFSDGCTMPRGLISNWTEAGLLDPSGTRVRRGIARRAAYLLIEAKRRYDSLQRDLSHIGRS